MSRVGRKPISILDNVKVEVKDRVIYVEGPKGKLSLGLPSLIDVRIEDKKIIVERKNDSKRAKSIHGTIRALINNMVWGVKEGFKKSLEIVGTGYKAQLKGNNLVLQLGFSHPVEIVIPQDLKVSLGGQTRIIIEGVDKQRVGQFAARIRAIFPPEPYKGKGIRYTGEEVRKKLGKAMAK
ncbi:MAG: 50S ribosomal protein L6 [Candidatus Omnitrophica bacterium 4484_70.2]|nr:MAG: 50S ribosomal protein L6 [Candidatus Omnitrophica bacterium 4484_70.2]